MPFGSRCHLHRVVRCELLPSILPPPGPTYRCPFTERFDGFKSIFGQSSGFTTHCAALESTVISPIPTSLTICCDKFAVDGHVADRDCVQVHLVRPPLSIIGVVTRCNFNWNFVRSIFSLTGDVILWSFELADVGTTPASGTQNRQECSLRGNFSHRAQTSVRFVTKDSFVAQRRTVLASHPNSHEMDPLRLGGLHCKVSETSRKASLSS